MTSVCRPEKITCRWVQEITEAINVLCPQAERVYCTPNHAEALWATYTEQELPKCLHHPKVNQIIRFEIDYNDIIRQTK